VQRLSCNTDNCAGSSPRLRSSMAAPWQCESTGCQSQSGYKPASRKSFARNFISTKQQHLQKITQQIQMKGERAYQHISLVLGPSVPGRCAESSHNAISVRKSCSFVAGLALMGKTRAITVDATLQSRLRRWNSWLYGMSSFHTNCSNISCPVDEVSLDQLRHDSSNRNEHEC
jgi:hypothetical protein